MTSAMSATQKRWTMVAVVLGSGIVFLDTSVVNLAVAAGRFENARGPTASSPSSVPTSATGASTPFRLSRLSARPESAAS